MTTRSRTAGRVSLAVGGLALVVPLLAAPPSVAVVVGPQPVNVSSAELPGNGDSFQPDLSSDGRFVAFASTSSNLTSGDDNAADDIFLRDTVAGTTRMVSRASADASGDSRMPSVSSDGRYVAFLSRASNLVPGDTNKAEDAFVKDMSTGAITLVGFGGAVEIQLSDNGRYVAVDQGEAYGIDRFDRSTGQVTFVSLSHEPDISANGRFVVGLGDDAGTPQVLFTDLGSGTTRDLLDSAPGTWSPGQTFEAPVISSSGRYVAFITDATRLLPSDTARNDDVYLVDTVDDTFQRLTPEFSTGMDPEWNAMLDVSMSGNGRVLGFTLADGRSDSESAVTLDRVTGLVSQVSGGFSSEPFALNEGGTRVAYPENGQVFLGSAAQCTITGTDGPDVLVGTNGADVICGRGGADVIEGRNGADVLSGGPGFDTISFSRANSDVGVNLRFYRALGAGQDEVYGFQQVDGSPFGDTLRGSAGPDTLRGLGGADRLLGAEGDDQLLGGAGNDSLDGEIGTDTCDGQAGTDTASARCEVLASIP